jgi:hypothetical protein
MSLLVRVPSDSSKYGTTFTRRGVKTAIEKNGEATLQDSDLLEFGHRSTFRLACSHLQTSATVRPIACSGGKEHCSIF